MAYQDEEPKPSITIGEALEVAAKFVGHKPLDERDAAAIQAAEISATGTESPPVNGIGLQAQAATMINARRIYDEDKTTIAQVIGDATQKLENDKPVTRTDAEKVRAAELQGDVEGHIISDLVSDDPKQTVTPGGVAEAIATAAAINQLSS